MASEDIKLKGFETAHAWSRLIVTLATGGILFTATFKENFAAAGTALTCTDALIGSWIALGIAAFLSVLFVGALVAKLNEGDEDSLDVYKGPPLIIGILQNVAFFIGLILLLSFAGANVA